MESMKKRDMNYACKKRTFSGAWLTAPLQYLESLEEFPALTEDAGKWIWPEAYVRGHIRKDFFLPEEAVRAEIELWCDNHLDLFINGMPAASFSGALKPLDITGYLRKGKNCVAIRAYQTDSPLRFTAAMRGCLSIRLSGGGKMELPTDGTWHSYEVSDFHKSQEPEQWTTMEHPGRAGREERKMVCVDVHPRLLRRSCFFRRKLFLSAPIARAVLASAVKGVYEVYVNGTRADDSALSPGVKERYLEYQETDITALLHEGENEVLFWLGNGWYNCASWGELRAQRPCVMGELEIEYANGEKEQIVTDREWETAASPLIDNDLQFGERYDAREEGNCRWTAAECLPVNGEEKPFVLQDYPPIRRTERLQPISVRRLADGARLYDFGKNGAGRSRVVLRGCRNGEVVKIQYCERLDEDGSPCIGPYVDVFFPYDCFPGGKAPFARRNLDVYLCKGEEKEVYEPRFAYTGFRYIYIETEQAVPEEVEMIILHTDLEENGWISTPDRMIRDLWEMITRSYRSNIFSGPTDCPSREKNFWNGDIQAFAHTACWYMDNSRFLARWTDGGRKIEYDVYGWEDEEYILPLVLYQFYGDREIVRAKFPAAEELLRTRRGRMTSDLPFGMRAPYRDHLGTENRMSSDYFACCYYCLSLKMLSKMAGILGLAQKEEEYHRQYQRAREEFLKVFYHPENGDFGQDCQGGQVLPLAFGLAEGEEREKAFDRLLYYIRRADHHLTTGFLATEHLLPLLCDFGHADEAWKIFRQEDFPSWKYMMRTGATTITEDWSGNAAASPFASLNHFTLGNVGRWFFEYLGGIRVDGSSPGFQDIVLRPLFVRELSRFAVRYKSVRGEIGSAWEFRGDEILWKIRIPEGTTAVIELPGKTVRCKTPDESEFKIKAAVDNRWII